MLSNDERRSEGRSSAVYMCEYAEISCLLKVGGPKIVHRAPEEHMYYLRSSKINVS